MSREESNPGNPPKKISKKRKRSLPEDNKLIIPTSSEHLASPPKNIAASLERGNARLEEWITSFKENRSLYIRIDPQDYQIDRIREFYESRLSDLSSKLVIFSLATGVGKTYLFGSIAIVTREKTLIVCPTNVLCEQTVKRLKEYAKNEEKEKSEEYDLVLLSIKTKRKIDAQAIEKYLKENKTLQGKPILIKQNDEFSIYGVSAQGKWQLTHGLDASQFEKLSFENKSLNEPALTDTQNIKSLSKAGYSTNSYLTPGSELSIPGDNSCLFWSVAIGILAPVFNDEKQYRSAFNNLFVSDNNDALLFREYGDGLKNRIQAFLASNDTTLILKQGITDPLYHLINWYFRQKVASYIDSHASEFSGFIPKPVTDYVTDLRNENFWGGNIEIRAIFKLLGEHYRLFVENSHISFGHINKPTVHIVHTNAKGKADGAKNHYNLRMPDIAIEINSSSSSDSSSAFISQEHNLENKLNKTVIILPGNRVPKEAYQEITSKKGHYSVKVKNGSTQQSESKENNIKLFKIQKLPKAPSKELLDKLFNENDCIVTTYQMLAGHLDKMPWHKIDSVVLDEAHRAFSYNRSQMVKTIIKNNCNVYAYTATPNNGQIRREDGGVSSCQELLNHPQRGITPITPLNFKEAIAMNANVPVVTALIKIEGIDIKLESQAGKEISSQLAQKQIEGQIEEQKEDVYLAMVDVYMNGYDSTGRQGEEKIWHRGEQCICFCPGIDSAKNLAACFNDKINIEDIDPDHKLRTSYEENNKNKNLGKFCVAKSVSSKKHKLRNKKIIEQYRAGGILVLTGADMLIEGFDNQRTSIVINLRPTKSDILKMQSCGRGFRNDPHNPDKICYVYDLYWGNTDCLYFFQYLNKKDQYQFQWGNVDSRRKKLIEKNKSLYSQYHKIPISSLEERIKIIRNVEGADSIIRGLRSKAGKSFKKNNLQTPDLTSRKYQVGYHNEVEPELKIFFKEIENLDQALLTLNNGLCFNRGKAENFAGDKEKIAPAPIGRNKDLGFSKMSVTDFQAHLSEKSKNISSLIKDVFSIPKKNSHSIKKSPQREEKKLEHQKKSTPERREKLEKIILNYKELIQQIEAKFSNSNPFQSSSKAPFEQLKNLIIHLRNYLSIHRSEIISYLYQTEIEQWAEKNKYSLTQLITDFVTPFETSKVNFNEKYQLNVSNVVMISEVIKFLAKKDFRKIEHSEGSQDDFETEEEFYEFPALTHYILKFRGQCFVYKNEVLTILLSVIPNHIYLDSVMDGRGTPLHALIRNPNSELDIDFFILLSARIKNIDGIGTSGNTYLHGAALEEKDHEWPTTQLLLLAKKANPALENDDNQTPANIVKKYSSKGIYANYSRYKHNTILVRDQYGRNVLHHVLNREFPSIHALNMLIEAKADINGKDQKGLTPLSYFKKISRTNVAAVKLLIEYKANVNAENNDRETILHILFKDFYNETKQLSHSYSARSQKILNPHEKFELFTYLIQVGSGEVNRINNKEMTPLQIIYEQFNLLFVFLGKQFSINNKRKIQNLINCLKIIENLNLADKEHKYSKSKEQMELEDTINHLQKAFNYSHREKVNNSIDRNLLPNVITNLHQDHQTSFSSGTSDSKQQSEIKLINNDQSCDRLEVSSELTASDVQSQDAYYKTIEFSSLDSLFPSSNKPVSRKSPQKPLSQNDDEEKDEKNEEIGQIGQWGENFIYQKLKQHYRQKYSGQITESPPDDTTVSSESKAFRGFELKGRQKSYYGEHEVFISVAWFNMWPSHCQDYVTRKQYESFRNIDMLITKRRTYDFFLYAKLPGKTELTERYKNTFIFIMELMNQFSELQLFYVNKHGCPRNQVINSSVCLLIIKEYITSVVNPFSWEGLIRKDFKMRLISKISINSEAEYLVKERYVEIKSTAWHEKHDTVFKRQQCDAMREHKEKYCIYRLFGVPQIHGEEQFTEPKIAKIKNPYKKIIENQLKFNSITLEI